MPLIRYTVECAGDEFRETVLFRRGNPETLVKEEVLLFLNVKRLKFGDPELNLKKIEVLNPHIHQHEWQKTFVNRSVLRSFYICKCCEVTGYKPFHIVNGETSDHVYRDEKYKKDKYETCNDALKEAPKKLNFN